MRITPREGWQAKVEALGLVFHTDDGENGAGGPYWDESAFYSFTARQVDELEKATLTLNDLCLKACEHVITRRDWAAVGIDAAAGDLVARSWEQDEVTVYGRFDLVYDGNRPPKMLEYNADTPTALLEAAVVQWHWAQERDKKFDQFNSIHERLIEAWGRVKKEVGPAVWFTSMGDSLEDFITVTYLRDTAVQAGLQTESISLEDIGCREQTNQFFDLQGREMKVIFKLYPWEWMLADQFGKHVQRSLTRWLEPPWKMVLSSKGLLAVMWELFPDCPYLLPTYRDPGPLGGGKERQGFGTYVEKPLRSREGANVRIVENGREIAATGGPYRGPCVYQAVCEPPQMGTPGGASARPVIGSWMVNGYACGIGIREDSGPITGNKSRFVPHVIEH